MEEGIRAVARRIAEAGRGERADVFHTSWWADRMLAWAMSHPEFKTQLFRFVDVFPACRDDSDVARHLEEYFDGVPVPAALELGLDAADHLPFGERITAAVARRNVRRMAGQFIAGATPEEAMRELKVLWRHGEAATVDLLGEKTLTLEEADRYAERVRHLLEIFAAEAATWPDDPHLERDRWGPVPRVNVSVKPTALAPSLSPLTAEAGLGQALDRLVPVCERARELGATVHLDTEHYDVKALTFELVRRLGAHLPSGPQLGCVVQAYLRDSLEDLRGLIAYSEQNLEVPLQIRLVKGAYWDQETVLARAGGWPSPVSELKDATDANYEACTQLLLRSAGSVRPAFASHNIRSLASAIVRAREQGLHDTSYELQLLYGMAAPVHAALRRMGLRVRAYVPVGELVPGMAYLVRRLLENTSNESFLRHRFAEGRELDELIRPPRDAATGTETPPAAEQPGFGNEPHAEFRRPGPRALMTQAVRAATEAMPFEVPMIVGGRREGAGEIDSVDPGAVHRLVCHSARATAADADRAVEHAQAAFPAWSRRPASERAAVLQRAAAIMRERRWELAALEVYEAGKPWQEADADVAEAIDFCEYYALQALRLASGAPLLQAPGEHNSHRYRPRGVGVVISPWNFPLAIPCGMVVAPLVAGNCVLFKPAEQTPGLALRLTEILLAAGAPEGTVALLPGVGEEIGAHLVGHPGISFVSFTGSKAVGLEIVRNASLHREGQRQVKRVIAEMGGKNAIVVDSDADLDVAVPAVVLSAFTYAGQKCSAASRVIAVGSVLDELCHRLVGATRLVPVGHPAEMGTSVGPLIDSDAFERLHRYRDIARSEGEVLVERDDVPDGGWYVGPSIVLLSPEAGRVASEEIFGPLLAIMPAADFDEALGLANATEYALTAGVFSRSPSRIRKAVEVLQAGNVYINRHITGALVGRQPFGGRLLSGVGSKAGGPDYLLQFLDGQVVSENTIRQGFAPLED